MITLAYLRNSEQAEFSASDRTVDTSWPGGLVFSTLIGLEVLDVLYSSLTEFSIPHSLSKEMLGILYF